MFCRLSLDHLSVVYACIVTPTIRKSTHWCGLSTSLPPLLAAASCSDGLPYGVCQQPKIGLKVIHYLGAVHFGTKKEEHGYNKNRIFKITDYR
jgi:hypothetical protein